MADIHIDIHDEDPTNVEWIQSQIKFKVIVERNENSFFKSTTQINRWMFAGVEVGKLVIFKFVDKSDDGVESVVNSFTRETAKHFELSLSDNRIVYLQLFDQALQDLVEYTIIFSNVHKKHQFMQLFNMEPFSNEKGVNIIQSEEESKSPHTESRK